MGVSNQVKKFLEMFLIAVLMQGGDSKGALTEKKKEKRRFLRARKRVSVTGAENSSWQPNKKRVIH